VVVRWGYPNNKETEVHINEIENRMAKASRFVEFIDEAGLVAIEDLKKFPRVCWDMIADAAGEQPPSDATIMVIIAMIESREKAIAAITASIEAVR